MGLASFACKLITLSKAGSTITLNLHIPETVTETTKAKAAGQAAWVRAIEKAAEQLLDNPYICECDGGLLILSYSNKTYHARTALASGRRMRTVAPVGIARRRSW